MRAAPLVLMGGKDPDMAWERFKKTTDPLASLPATKQEEVPRSF